MGRVSYIRVSAFVCVVLGLVGVAGDHRVSAQTAASGPSQFEIGAFRHGTHAESQTSLELPNTNEFPLETETVSPPPPTRSSFMATWPSVTGAEGYLLDVSTSSSFDSFVDGYHDLDVRRRDRSSSDRVEQGHDVLLPGSRLQCHRTNRLFGNERDDD